MNEHAHVAPAQVAGYYVEYDGLLYATVRGAGHMVRQGRGRRSVGAKSVLVKCMPAARRGACAQRIHGRG
eukprot:357404-Chlamydomonas_euryale.AAC.1